MHSHYASFFLVVVTLLGATSFAHAGGSPVSELREAQLPHVCNDGAKKGEACTKDTQCPSGLCEINYLRGPDATLEAEVTLIIDDDVSKYDGSEEINNVKAATVLLEIQAKRQTHMLAQTYQNLEGHNFKALVDALKAGPFLADMGSPVSNRRVAEFRLFESLTDDPFPSILDDFLFEEGDTELANAVRALAGVRGRPVIANVPADPASVQRSDHVADGLASLVRLKVGIRFVAQKPKDRTNDD
jgi:hypothetical protein